MSSLEPDQTDTTTKPVRPPSLTRDIVTTGVFTALYFVVMAIVGQLSALIPILQVLAPFYIPILCGIPFMLFLTRVHRFGMITAMGWIIGLLLMLTNAAILALILGLVLAPLADWIAHTGKYRRWSLLVVSYILVGEISIGMVGLLFFQRQAVLNRIGQHHDAAWVAQIAHLTPPWMLYVMIGELAVGAIIGAFLGRGIFRKHYRYLAPTSAQPGGPAQP